MERWAEGETWGITRTLLPLKTEAVHVLNKPCTHYLLTVLRDLNTGHALTHFVRSGSAKCGRGLRKPHLALLERTERDQDRAVSTLQEVFPDGRSVKGG